MDKRALLLDEIRKLDLAIGAFEVDLEKYELLEDDVMLENTESVLALCKEKREKYLNKLNEMEER